MVKLLLDTNIVSAMRRPERVPQVGEWLRYQDGSRLYISVITLGELVRGVVRQERVNPPFSRQLRVWVDQVTVSFEGRILDFDAEAARLWGALSARIGNAEPDLQIAATALARNATVVTRNTADFAATGCRLLDPFAA